MISRFIEFLQSPSHWVGSWRFPLTGLLVLTGVSVNVSTQSVASAQQLRGVVNFTDIETTLSTASPRESSIEDGTYLYGQSSEPNQIGKEYIVFQAHDGKLVGALYLPQSEFSCFQGSIESKQMDLRVVNPYDQTALAHRIENQQQNSVVAVGSQIRLDPTYESLSYPYTVRLDDYQPIGQLSENDLRILNICQTNYSP